MKTLYNSNEVPFMDAVKAYAKGNVIRCQYGSASAYNPSQKGTFLKDDLGAAITTEEILNGKWFILDE